MAENAVLLEESRPPPSPPWQLEFARLVVFLADPASFLKQQWWQGLTRFQPEDYVLTQKAHSFEERGTFEDVALSLVVNPVQMEWLIQPIAEFNKASGWLPTLGPFQKKLHWFVELMGAWLKAAPPVLRIGLAGKLLHAAETQDEAFRELTKLLPGVRLEPQPNDFLFHVNRRRESKVLRGLPINRVSAWSKMNVLFSTPRIGFEWPQKCYCALQLDLNTAPERRDSLPRETLPALLTELESLGVEIAEKGDIP